MRQPPTPRHALRSAVALTALVASGTMGALCEPDRVDGWICLNPVTGKLDDMTYDGNHVVNGQSDPCHCYDLCGSQKTCPIWVDAGPPPLGCDAGDGGP